MESNDKINNNENEYNNLKPTDFQDLTPIDDVDLTGYKEALDRAFNDDKIKNIAITGSYGSGKSSILNTYKKDSKLKFIHISFLHFKECDKNDINTNENKEKSNNKEDSKESKDIEENKEQNSDNKNVEKNKIEENTTKIEFSLDCGNENKNEIDKDKIREAVLERKIINHIINQIPFKYISDTNFNVRGNIGIVQAVTKVLFGIAILYVILFFTDDKLDKLFGLFKFIDKLKPYTISIYILLYCSIIYILIYSVILFKKLRWKNIFKKLNFKNIELDLDKLSNDYDKYDSFFDRYLNEILYVFENCKADVVVFEDIDRFEMGVIFERLREINLLLNENLNYKDNIIKFCYLMRDDIFGSEDRVKFFDFIIPVVTVMNGFNSHDKFLEYFDDEKIKDKIDKTFLKEISYYIINMRLFKNICNEFSIYLKTLNIDEMHLNYNKLLAIIVYKNLFPKDFNDLNHNKGLLFSISGSSDIYIRKMLNEYLEKLNIKLEKYNNEIRIIKQNLKDTYNLNLYESDIKTYVFDLLLEEKRSDFLNCRLRKYIEFCHFRERDYMEYEVIYENKKVLKELVDTKEIVKFKYEIINDEYFIECVKQNVYTDFRGEYLEQFNGVLETIFDNVLDKLGDDGIKYRNFWYKLIEYGFKDRMWEMYLTYPSKNFIEDKNFLLNIFHKNEIFDFNYKLSNVLYVVDKSSYIDYIGNKYIFNFDLLDYLLDKNDFFIIQQPELRNKLICFLLQLGEASNFNFVVEYFNNNITKNKLEYNDNLIEKLTIIQIKFENINNDFLCEDLLKKIDKKNLYEVNEENLRIILKRYGYESNNHLCSKIYSLICEKAKSLNHYIHNRYNKNIYIFLIFYFNNCNNCIKDDSNHVVNLIKFLFNKNFENDENIDVKGIFKNYIDLLDVKIVLLYNFDVNEFKDEIRIVMYKYIFKKNVVKYCIENIYDYYLRIGQLDNLIIKFINESNENLKFSNMHDEDYFEFSLKILNNKENIEKFLSELKNDERINENKRIEIQSCIDELDEF